MRKALGWDKVLPVLLITAGVIFFMLTGLEGSSTTGNLIALTESVSFALLTVSAKKAAGENPLGLTAVANLFTGFFVFIFLPPKFTNVLAFDGQDWLIILILGPIWVALFLREYPSLLVCIGFVIIIAGIVLDAKLTRPAGELQDVDVA